MERYILIGLLILLGIIFVFYKYRGQWWKNIGKDPVVDVIVRSDGGGNSPKLKSCLKTSVVNNNIRSKRVRFNLTPKVALI